MHAVENQIGDQTLWTVSHPAPQALAVPKAVGIDHLPATLPDYHPAAPDSAEAPM